MSLEEPPWPDGLTKERPALRLIDGAAQPQKPPEKRAPIDWPALAGKDPPPRKWAEKGWFGFGHTTLLVGQGGIGKTLLSQQWGSCLATGRGLIEEAPEPQKVLMWACEDDHDELWRRQIAISHWLGSSLDAFAERLVIVPRHGLENTLVSTEFGKLLFAPLLEELKEQAADLAAQVVILDNVAQLYGGNENDRHSVTVFLNALAGVLPGRAVLLLAHPSRGAGSEFSGSSAWENTVRTRLYLGSKLPGDTQEEAPNEDVRYLARRKSNYSSRDWRKFNYRDGVLVPEAQETQGGIVGHLRTKAAEKLVLEALVKLAEMGVTATDGTTSPRFLPKAMQDYKLGSDYSKRDLADAMRALMLNGKISRAKVGVGNNRNPVYGLQINTAEQ